ncbi:hypothetical protein L6274_01050 [Candidatus Parcubacteria bacterium]|nr:hypothetical protein [Candidatus Parcubacteria bacterium]
MKIIYQFFNHPFFVMIGGISTLIAVIGLLLVFMFFIFGITPLLWRLGLGRWIRKIAIASDDEIYNSLRADMIDSGIFRKGNIVPISSDHLAKVKDHNLILIHYQSFNQVQIKEILSNKKSGTGMIFYYPEYSPRDDKKIPNNMIRLISSKENTTIVNFRGRLLNDIITTLIATSYAKK